MTLHAWLHIADVIPKNGHGTCKKTLSDRKAEKEVDDQGSFLRFYCWTSFLKWQLWCNGSFNFLKLDFRYETSAFILFEYPFAPDTTGNLLTVLSPFHQANALCQKACTRIYNNGNFGCFARTMDTFSYTLSEPFSWPETWKFPLTAMLIYTPHLMKSVQVTCN